ncbi:pyridoxamine 5'-phosphate oxidase family protein [Pelagibius sp. Alg239-R121]|uniref:pyridoxamine 5'-phosphate oxidase family protein n=1 Tax=Pelagibius sp. Alg239-R121 TaxID=2993448 RepID=UPI0024A6ECE2|nr:pyridoxamine 5'-phosphate oxidase family protein [Pelagibius sp. Alg239-R121]
MLTDDMKRIVAEQKLGYVASVCADGSPNLSPKGTFLVRDNDHLMFAEIRSPNTRANIQNNPLVEINFVDLFSRKGFRCKGPARFVEEGTDEFTALLPSFIDGWGEEFATLINGIVVISVEAAGPLSSPAYDIGAEEGALRQQWLAYFTKLQES